MDSEGFVVRERIYTRNQILLAGFLGGPLAATYAAYGNAKKLDANRSAGHILWIGFALFSVLYLAISLLPTDTPNNSALAVLFFIPVVLFYDSVLGERTKEEIEAGPGRSSWWKAVAVGIQGAIATLLLLLLLFTFVPLQPSNTLEYGDNIIYYEDDATEADAQELAQFLESEGVINPNIVWEMTLVRTRGENNAYILEIPIEGSVENTSAEHFLRALQQTLQVHFSKRHVEVHATNVWGRVTFRASN